MINVTHNGLKENIYINRTIGEYSQGTHGPLLVVTAGIHGNETSGIFALNKVFSYLKKENVSLKGKFVGIAGNLAALNGKSRFLREDLNRIFFEERLQEIRKGEVNCHVEENEAAELMDLIKALENEKLSAKYFLDCHSTSSESQPFACINKGKENYQFAKGFPVHNIHGLGAEIKGTWSKYLMSNGYVGLTFEAGQHNDISSVENQEAAIWLALVEAACVDIKDIPLYKHYYELLGKTVIDGKKTFDIANHYKIDPEEDFMMEPGFVNFQIVEKGTLLAKNKYGNILSPVNGRIFMPLYQRLGEDGFFIIREREELEESYHAPEKANTNKTQS